MTLTNGIKLPASGLFLAKIPNLFGHSSKAAPSEIQDFSSKLKIDEFPLKIGNDESNRPPCILHFLLDGVFIYAALFLTLFQE